MKCLHMGWKTPLCQKGRENGSEVSQSQLQTQDPMLEGWSPREPQSVSLPRAIESQAMWKMLASAVCGLEGQRASHSTGPTLDVENISLGSALARS